MVVNAMTNPMQSRESFNKGAIEGVELGVHSGTRVIQGIHEAVLTSVARRAPVPAPVHGLTDRVYRAIRGLASLLARGGVWSVDRFGDGDGGRLEPWQLHCVSGFNAAWGDSFAEHGHPWALPMGFAAGDDPDRFTTGLPDWLSEHPSPHLVVFIHGLGMNELAWQHAEGTGLPERLASENDCQPLFLRYNTGRPIHANGADLADKLEELVNGYPVPVQTLTLVGHSMGGLVALSASHQALAAGHRWTGLLQGLCCLGAPHQGAKLETAGNWLTHILSHTPYSAPLAIIGQWRSAGIKDLRHGSLRADDWDERDRNDVTHFHPHPVNMVPGTHYLVIGSTLPAARSGTLEQTVGDGLVTPDSALNPRLVESVDEPERITATRLDGIGHIRLLTHSRVGDELSRWYRHTIRPDATGT